MKHPIQSRRVQKKVGFSHKELSEGALLRIEINYNENPTQCTSGRRKKTTQRGTCSCFFAEMKFLKHGITQNLKDVMGEQDH